MICTPPSHVNFDDMTKNNYYFTHVNKLMCTYSQQFLEIKVFIKFNCGNYKVIYLIVIESKKLKGRNMF